MGKHIIIREYGCFGKEGDSSSLDFSIINEHDWCWLKEICMKRVKGEAEFLRLISRFGQECIQVRNYVGVLEAPSGLQIEILPKITSSINKKTIVDTRKLLWKMLSAINNISSIETEEADLEATSSPILEVLIGKFLNNVGNIVRRGIRNDYVRKHKDERFLKGRLNVSRQVRRLPSQSHIFDVEYDNYLSDRAENRLIHSALRKVLLWSKNSINQRLARELLFSFDLVPYSNNIDKDFTKWRNSRDMVYYQPVKSLCQMILNEISPLFTSGKWKGVSLLFPMERLFEKYVGMQLRKQIHTDYRIVEQGIEKHLVRHIGNDLFALQPDILIKKENKMVLVMDAKWKLLNSNMATEKSKYKISQTDLYQLFAYGQKYLVGSGEVFLIYPLNENFNSPLPPFDYSSELRLWVVPYDLNSDSLLLHELCKNIDVLNPLGIGEVA